MGKQVKKYSGKNELTSRINRSFVEELKIDLKRARCLTVLSLGLMVLTTSLQTGMREARFCFVLSISSTIALDLFLRKFKKIYMFQEENKFMGEGKKNINLDKRDNLEK